jgi:hypothetical protein
MYVNDYYAIAREQARLHPDLMQLFDIEALNTRQGQKRIFDFVGIPEERRVYPGPVQENALVAAKEA